MQYIPSSVAFEVIRLIEKLGRLQPGETLDHPWGFVRREEIPKTEFGVFSFPDLLQPPGFRLAAPGQSGAEGNWREGVILPLVDEMLENHLRSIEIIGMEDDSE